MMKEHETGASHDAMSSRPYVMLAINLVISLVIMYFAMFVMIWSFGDLYNNSNMLYMALVMWAPMGILMLLMMPTMYPDRTRNLILLGFFVVVLALSFWAVRDQTFVGDRQFVRAMIPHHSGAITMCDRASLKDQEIRDICFKPGGIVESQKREIAQMESILKRL